MAEFVGGFAIFLVVDPINDHNQSITNKFQKARSPGDHPEYLLNVPGVIIAIPKDLDQPLPGMEGQALHQIVELFLLQIAAVDRPSLEQLQN